MDKQVIYNRMITIHNLLNMMAINADRSNETAKLLKEYYELLIQYNSIK
jgi:hypothetical protein